MHVVSKTAAHFWAACTIPPSFRHALAEKGTDTFLGIAGEHVLDHHTDSEVVASASGISAWR